MSVTVSVGASLTRVTLHVIKKCDDLSMWLSLCVHYSKINLTLS